MKPLLLASVLAVASMLPLGAVSADPSLAEALQAGCRQDLESYCSSVRPGQGRVLACLHAHGDRLSQECKLALDDVTRQLENTAAAVRFVAAECEDDIKAHCGTVKPGEGRVLACLERNGDQVSSRCIGALEEVGLR